MRSNLLNIPMTDVHFENEHFSVVLMTYKKKKDITTAYFDSMSYELTEFLDRMKFMKPYDIKIVFVDDKSGDKNPDFKDDNVRTRGFFLRHETKYEVPNTMSPMLATDNNLHVSMYSTGSIVHEFGHAVNYVGKPDSNGVYHDLSDYSDFTPIYNEYLKELDALWGPHDYDRAYYSTRDEAWAAGFNIYYNASFKNTKLTQSNPKIRERAMENVMKKNKELFFTYYAQNVPELEAVYQKEQAVIEENGIRFAGWSERGYAYQNIDTDEIMYLDEYQDVVNTILRDIVDQEQLEM